MRHFLTACFAVCSIALMAANGCNKQQTTADLILIAGSSINQVEIADGRPDLGAKILADTQKASAQIASFKTGDSKTVVIQLVQDVRDDLSSFPSDSKVDLYISLALNTVDAVLTEYGATTQPSSIQAHNSTVTTVTTVPAPNTVDEYKKQFNAIQTSLPIAKL